MTEVKTDPVHAKRVDFDVVYEAGLDALKEHAGGFEFVNDREGRVSMMIMI